ncbi:hypothetical protein QFZ80_004130 [Paenibacillus sp. V4I7]|nr:hypothetical protein [Paenibacillus sp. V4I7]
MANNKKKNLTMTQQEYQKLAKKQEPKRPVLINCMRAFLVGGAICLIGECFMQMFINWFGFTEKNGWESNGCGVNYHIRHTDELRCVR